MVFDLTCFCGGRYTELGKAWVYNNGLQWVKYAVDFMLSMQRLKLLKFVLELIRLLSCSYSFIVLLEQETMLVLLSVLFLFIGLSY